MESTSKQTESSNQDAVWINHPKPQQLQMDTTIPTEISTQDPKWTDNPNPQQLQTDTISTQISDFESTLNPSELSPTQELAFLKRRINTISSLLTHLNSKSIIPTQPSHSFTPHPQTLETSTTLDSILPSTQTLTPTSQTLVPTSETLVPTSETLDFPLPSPQTLDFPLPSPQTLDPTSSALPPTSSTLSSILSSIQTLARTLEALTLRLHSAQSSLSASSLSLRLSLQELRQKSLQVRLLESRLSEMEAFARGTTELLGEMKERVEEMVGETGRQRARAAENEAELARVKRDFEGLRGFVGSLIEARECVEGSERVVKSAEKVFDRMMVKNSQLENEKAQKDVEIKKLIEENVKLGAKLDQKEAQLFAMNEQFKFMALNDRNF